MNNYTVSKEIKSFFTRKRLIIWLVIMSYPLMFFIIFNSNYTFRNEFDVFNFMLDGIIPLLFVPLAVLLYTSSFSEEVKNRFLVYTRLRIPLRKMLRIKMLANILVTFTVVFVFIFGCFVFAFYIEPFIILVLFSSFLLIYASRRLENIQ